ncbi:MAG: response regulator [Chthoniobacterales bacterium]
MDGPKRILLVEDSAKDIELALEALGEHKLANQVAVVRDGAEALDYLYRRGHFANHPDGLPVLVLLDLKMPKVDGLEVLRQMKADPVLKRIPVVMMTSSREHSDLTQSYELGVNSYVVKPVKFQEFIDAVKHLGLYWVLVNEAPPAVVSGPAPAEPS